MKAGFKMIDGYQSKHPFSPCLPPHDESFVYLDLQRAS
jgi:hypothetical protein